MSYQLGNFRLLREVHDLLKAFPFNEESEKRLNSMDFEGILNEYSPHSEMENDPVANAICWGVSILRTLHNKKPVRALDEVMSFVAHTLNGQNHEIH